MLNSFIMLVQGALIGLVCANAFAMFRILYHAWKYSVHDRSKAGVVIWQIKLIYVLSIAFGYMMAYAIQQKGLKINGDVITHGISHPTLRGKDAM